MKKILVVDDEKSLASMMSSKLNSSGYQTTAVYDGRQALATLSKESFDLMILDLLMPNGDGFFVLNKLKKLKSKIPIIIVASNLSSKEDIEKAKKLGALDYFNKSDFTLEEMVNKVKQYLPV